MVRERQERTCHSRSIGMRQTEPARRPRQCRRRLFELDLPHSWRVRDGREAGARAEVPGKCWCEDAGLRANVLGGRPALDGEAWKPGGDVEERVPASNPIPVDEQCAVGCEADVVASYVEMEQGIARQLGWVLRFDEHWQGRTAATLCSPAQDRGTAPDPQRLQTSPRRFLPGRRAPRPMPGHGVAATASSAARTRFDQLTIPWRRPSCITEVFEEERGGSRHRSSRARAA